MRKLLILAAVAMLAGCDRGKQQVMLKGHKGEMIHGYLCFSSSPKTELIAVGSEEITAYLVSRSTVATYTENGAGGSGGFRSFSFEDSDGDHWTAVKDLETELPSRGRKDAR